LRHWFDDALRSSVIPVLGVFLVVVVTTTLGITGIVVVKRQNDVAQTVLTRIARTGDENTATLRNLVDDVEKVILKNRLATNRSHCAIATVLVEGTHTRAAQALLKAACR
jgi:hypothetical protein